MEVYDIVFFDWVLLCHSNFFPHFYPELKGVVGLHMFGYSRAEKEQHGKPLDHPAEGVRAAEALLPVGDGGQILLRGGGEKALSPRCWRRSSS